MAERVRVLIVDDSPTIRRLVRLALSSDPRIDIVGDAGPQPAPVPRFSRTPGAIQRPPPRVGEHTDEVLHDWGFAADEIAHLRRDAVIT